MATLRTWETRYGQPVAQRLPGGHRRYGDDAVEAVERILGQRAAGMSMEAAVARAAPTSGERHPSVVAMLRERHPDIPAQRLTKTTLLALTHAVEDEYLARADRAVLFGFFQRERYYRSAEQRWLELARSAEFACVVADFDGAGGEAVSPVRVSLPPDSPMLREWVLLCDSPGFTACVAGWERPGQEKRRDRDREYEAVWTLDPRVVRDVARTCLAHVEGLSPAAHSAIEARLADLPAEASEDLRRANAVFRRLVEYLDVTR